MAQELIGDKIDWDKIASVLETAFDFAAQKADATSYPSDKITYSQTAADFAQALVRVSAEQRAVVKDQRERNRTQPSFNKPRD